jgi:crotonobetainyl-CoA:carnitine CoA-transferase CaiB-like acyl-CoA transferase
LTKSYSLYKCKDGFLSIAALSDAQWFGIFRALGLPEYIEDERFNNAFARSENMVELVKSLTIFESLTVDDALQKLQDEDVPCSKTISLDELMTHPQIEANNLFQSINSDIQGKVRALRYPTKFDDNEMFNDKPAPALGEHKQEIIESLSN